MLFFDTETTGMIRWKEEFDAPTQPRIVQLAFLAANNYGEEEGFLTMIIRPDGWVIPDDVAAIHGITTERAMDEGIPLGKALEEFESHLHKHEIIIAHNMNFDYRMYRREAAASGRLDVMESKQRYCTMFNSTRILNLPGKFGAKWPKLSEAYEYFMGKPLEGAHDALVDARACKDVYFAIVKHHGAAA